MGAIFGVEGQCCAGLWKSLVAGRRQSPRERVVSGLFPDWVILNGVGQTRTLKTEYAMEDHKMSSGAFGDVKKVTGTRTGAELVVKVISKPGVFRSGTLDVAHLRSEIECHAKCDHPHIVRLIEVFETQMELCMVMEACSGGEVFDALARRGRLGELESWHVFSQVMGALVYLHSKVFLAHRDLKPENLLVKEAGLPLDKSTIKLIDFGFARTFEPGKRSLKTFCGTRFYMAPEIWEGSYDEMCDIWAGGVLLYVLLTGYMPFDGESLSEILEAARRGLSASDPQLLGKPPSAQSLIRWMCSVCPRQRPSAAEVLNTPWMQQTRENVAQTQESSPTMSAGQVARGLKQYQGMTKIKRLALGAMGHVLEDKDVALLRNTFKALDIEGHGVISVSSLKRALTDDAKIAPADVGAMTRGLAKDGHISYSAFLAANMKREHYTKEEHCWDAFRIIDRDGDGSISLSDLKEMMKKSATQSFGYSSFEATEQFKAADKDGDGRVNFEEFVVMVRANDGCSSGRPSFAAKAAA